MKKKKIKKTLFALLLFAFFNLSNISIVYAQSDNNNKQTQDRSQQYIEDEGDSLWNNDDFVDPGTFQSPDGSELSPDEDDKYLDPDEIKRMQDYQYKKDMKLNISQAKLEQVGLGLSANILYGIGIGLLVGGWLALGSGTNARENLRYIGTGVVLGTLLGFLVGTKPLYQADKVTKPTISKIDPSQWKHVFFNIFPKNHYKSKTYKVAMGWQTRF